MMGCMQSGNTEAVVIPRSSDIGGFGVKRALPARERRMVGPFVFLDQMGPAVMRAGRGLDVAPHPHIGLATVTWLFEGELLHRDSLGSVQAIAPGAVNWMVAGRGIVHSERSPESLRAQEHRLFGIQSWVALPRAHEESAPGFRHHPADALPTLEGDGIVLRLIAGTLLGKAAPVETVQELFYADLSLASGASLALDAEHEERAAYLVSGEIELGNDRYAAPCLLVFRPAAQVVIRAMGAARLMLLGGSAMDGHRVVWWNFVASSRNRIEQAKEDWRQGRFDPVPDETERIPLPGEKWPTVDYP